MSEEKLELAEVHTAEDFMASIRETVELADVPSVARNMGMVLILAGSLSLAFMGFAGLFSS